MLNDSILELILIENTSKNRMFNSLSCRSRLVFFLHIGEVASGLPELKLPPMQTTIGDQTLYFTDMIAHVGSSVLALPLISILESIAVAKAFCKHFSFFLPFA